MAEIAFYHLQRSALDAVLPKLLQRTLDQGKRALVLAGSDERVENLSSMLWTYDPGSWLPHGTVKDGRAEDQPIWLTVSADNSNRATFLFLTDGTEADPTAFERCFDLFDGNDDSAVAAARERWKRLKEAGHMLTYWQQNERGAWEKKA
ncbi:MAG: putative polymerase chi subunit [Rhodospirillales bacterium]|nr:putative polymerase chi subunit [Rhodospirillales bacterium]